MITGKGKEVSDFIRNTGGESFDEAWTRLRADDSIQFTELELPESEPPPSWLEDFFEWLGEILQPVGETMVDVWPVMKWALIAGATLLIAYLVYRLVAPIFGLERADAGAEEEQWAPDESEALALLEEADRLADQGRFDEATHLLLMRSVGQIAAVRPDMVEPSSTARELSADPRLPDKARSAFAIIAGRVERSLFALVKLDRQDWTAAREAYSEFALQQRALAG